MVTSDVAFLARAEPDVRARLLMQASNGMQALRRASKGLGYMAHGNALLDRLHVLLQEGSLSSANRTDVSLAVQIARSYILSKVSSFLSISIFFFLISEFLYFSNW
jgi:hypothetical protein